MILIVGSTSDPHVEGVTLGLERRGAPFAILDLFSNAGCGVLDEICDGVDLYIGARSINLNSLTAVWWRHKPRGGVPSESAKHLYDYNFIQKEYNYLLNYISGECEHLFCINNRDNAAKADNKLVQLRLAREFGFRIPRTLVSNNPEAIIQFMNSVPDAQYVFKTLTPYMPPTGEITFTSLVNEQDISSDAASVRAAPGIYQERIRKKYELRITVVGSTVFAAKINSGRDQHGAVDWRRTIFADIYSPITLGNPVRDMLIRLHSRFGLVFAAYDLIVDEDDNVIFLEVNPSGQWMWLEDALGLSIADAIAAELYSHRKCAGVA